MTNVLERVLELLVLMKINSIQIDTNTVPEAPGSFSQEIGKLFSTEADQLRELVTNQELMGRLDQEWPFGHWT